MGLLYSAPEVLNPDWLAAVSADNAFVTTYAATSQQEDFAEHALVAYAMIFHPDRFPKADRAAIQKQIPNRIEFFRRKVFVVVAQPPPPPPPPPRLRSDRDRPATLTWTSANATAQRLACEARYAVGIAAGIAHRSKCLTSPASTGPAAKRRITQNCSSMV